MVLVLPQPGLVSSPSVSPNAPTRPDALRHLGVRFDQSCDVG